MTQTALCHVGMKKTTLAYSKKQIDIIFDIECPTKHTFRII